MIDTVYAISYYMAYKGGTKPAPRLGHFFDTITDTTNFMYLQHNIKYDTQSRFMCLNDDFTKPIQSEQLQDLYEELYPTPSRYERPASSVSGAPRLPRVTPSGPTPPVHVRFVSFYSEGQPYDRGLPLSSQKEGAIQALQGHCPSSFYTPRRLRELGYDYAVKEFEYI